MCLIDDSNIKSLVLCCNFVAHLSSRGQWKPGLKFRIITSFFLQFCLIQVADSHHVDNTENFTTADFQDRNRWLGSGEYLNNLTLFNFQRQQS